MPEYDAYSVYYDLLGGDMQDDVPFFLDMAKEMGGAVCELACGTGQDLVLCSILRREFEAAGRVV